MIKAVVDPGICGMIATITTRKTGKLCVKIEIESPCSKVTNIASSFANIAIRDALKPQINSQVYQCASVNNFCASCPVPMGILKSIEIEMGLALPKPVNIDFEVVQ